jgi:hypothetical protein
VIGVAALALAGLSSIPMIVPAAAASPFETAEQAQQGVAIGMVICLLTSAFFVTIGIGSIFTRRWARALMLVVSWIWLAIGVMSLLGLTLLLPMVRTVLASLFEQATAQQRHPESVLGPTLMANSALVYMFAFVLLLQIVLPSIFVLFHQSPHVKATCEAHDRRPRWTDRVPLPVLALVLLLGSGAAILPGSVLAHGALALFGRVVEGAAALVIAGSLAAVLAVAAAWSWRLELRGWWLSVGVWTFGFASSVGAILRPLDWNEVYRAMDMDPGLLAEIGLDAWNRQFAWLTLAAQVAWLAYLLWVRHFFRRPAPAAALVPRL